MKLTTLSIVSVLSSLCKQQPCSYFNENEISGKTVVLRVFCVIRFYCCFGHCLIEKND